MFITCRDTRAQINLICVRLRSGGWPPHSVLRCGTADVIPILHLLCVDGVPGELCQVDKFEVQRPELGQNAAPR